MSIWSCNLVHFFLSVFLAIPVIDAMRSLGWSDRINAWQCQGSHQRVITQEGGFSQGVCGSPRGLRYSGIFISKSMGPRGPHPRPKWPQQFIMHLLDSQLLKRVIGSTIANIFMYSYNYIQLLCSYACMIYSDNNKTSKQTGEKGLLETNKTKPTTIFKMRRCLWCVGGG